MGSTESLGQIKSNPVTQKTMAKLTIGFLRGIMCDCFSHFFIIHPLSHFTPTGCLPLVLPLNSPAFGRKLLSVY